MGAFHQVYAKGKCGGGSPATLGAVARSRAGGRPRRGIQTPALHLVRMESWALTLSSVFQHPHSAQWEPLGDVVGEFLVVAQDCLDDVGGVPDLHAEALVLH